MPVQPLIDNGRLRRVDHQTLEVSSHELQWHAVFYAGRNGDTLYALEDGDWDALQKFGFGLHSCILKHDNIQFTQIVCDGKHPNMDPERKQFCVNGSMEYTLDKAIAILHALANPNFHNWFDTWKVETFTPVFDLIDTNDQEGRTMKIS